MEMDIELKTKMDPEVYKPITLGITDEQINQVIEQLRLFEKAYLATIQIVMETKI